ncbi:MAG: hypothetical protein RXO71_03180 [Nitrososphaeria archaeon]
MSKLVVPGEIVAKGNFRSWVNVLKKGEEYLSLFVGRAEISGGRVRVIRLSGPYIPKVGDFVIGVVTDVQPLAATLDINSYVNGYILANAFFKRRIDPSKFDLSNKVNIGDLVAARVKKIERGKDIVLQPDQKWKVEGDAIFYISPAKAHYLYASRSRIPSKIKELTGAELRLGANGIVVVKGDLKKIEMVKKALDVIESTYNLNGLYGEIIKVLSKDGKSADN